MSDPTDVASDPATDAVAADDADDNDDDARRISARRRHEPCCRLVDVLRAALVRGTCGIGGRCGRCGGMRDAWGCDEGVGGSALLPPLPLLQSEGEEDVAEAKGFGTPRMCTMPAPSRVSSRVHDFDVDDAVDGARTTAGASCCQLYVVTLGRARAGEVEVKAPITLPMLLRSESRQASIVPGCKSVCDSAGFKDERSRRSFHLLEFSGAVDPCCVSNFGCITGSGVGVGSGSSKGVWIQGTSSPEPFRLR
jgi:hypothetical protein